MKLVWIKLTGSPVPDLTMLSRGCTSDYLLAMVMRFSLNLSRRQRAVQTTRVATLVQVLGWRQPLLISLKKIARNSMSWTFRDKITNFVTRLAATARRRRDNVKKKIASPLQAKNRSCSRGFRTGSWFAFVATKFFILWKKSTKNKNRDEFEFFERWITERLWRFYVPWTEHLIFQTARFARQDKKSIVFSNE